MTNKRFTFFLTLIACLSLGTFSSAAKANEVLEDTSVTAPQESIPDLFLRAYTHNAGEFFDRVSLEDQFNLIFGFNQFPENQIARDTEILDILRRDFQNHMTTDERLRTRDLANPFQGSLNENPNYLRPFAP